MMKNEMLGNVLLASLIGQFANGFLLGAGFTSPQFAQSLDFLLQWATVIFAAYAGVRLRKTPETTAQ